MVQEISISVEETNKLRLKLGLKPIPLQNEPSKSSNELSISETNQLRQSLGLKPIEDTASDKSEIQPEISKKPKEAAYDLDKTKQNKLPSSKSAKFGKETGKRKLIAVAGNDDNDNDNDDDDIFGVPESTDDWLQNLGNQTKKLKTTISNSKEDAEVSSGKGVGIKVAHSSKELEQITDNEVLTLKDSTILQDEEDELCNESLNHNSATEKRLKEKAKVEHVKLFGRHFDDFNGSDDDNEQAKDNLVFEDNIIKFKSKSPTKKEEPDSNEKKKLVITDLFNEEEDTAKESKSIKMKKIKKKSKSKSKSSKKDNSLVKDIGNIEVVDLANGETDDVEDDNETLEQYLSRKRRLKTKHMTPENIAQQILTHKILDREKEAEEKSINASINQVIFDDTSNFLNSLDSKQNQINVIGETAYDTKEETKPLSKVEADHTSSVETEMISNASEKEGPSVSKSAKSNDSAVENTYMQNNEANEVAPEANSVNFNGLASTLKYLQKNNIVKPQTRDDQIRAQEYRAAQKESEILKFKISIEERLLREELALDKNYMNKPKDEREQLFQEYLNYRLQDKHIIPNKVEPNSHTSNLKNYNPNVSLSYKDDEGNELQAKAAYKQLSHKFHGVGPNKSKFKKIANKKKSTTAKIIE